MGVGDRGAQFIAHNLVNLTTLYIRTQWRYSGDNNIGEQGATAIARGLVNLTVLGICTQWRYSENNGLSPWCKQQVRQNLPKTDVSL